MGKRQGLLFALATVALVALATFYFTRTWLPPLKSDRVAIDHAIWLSLVVTGAVFILTNLLLAYFSWRYQDDGRTRAAYWHHNPRLEWAWTLVTALIMCTFLFKALNLWAEVTSPPPADAMLIEVTGQQFAWNVRYPGPDGMLGRTDHLLASQENPIGLDKSDPHSADDVLLLNQMVLPQDRPVRVQIRSMDVIHSFFLPNFRVKQDAVPGMTVQIWFRPQGIGDYEIACAEHCGLGHYRMRGQVHVVSAPGFDKALADAAAQ
ncbi:MAG TPA: cytochrome c oxidase subunit II [Candidatus Dormibacteraeota bacterium]|nr:cytochrome c oxidase subunit II [Candidatus Dormibacteraeota bacterium]